MHGSLFWRMKRHLAKLKAARATSHGKSTVTGHGESTGAKGASKDYLGFWSGAIPPFALGWWFCVQGALRFQGLWIFFISEWITLHCWILTVTMS